jgi:hypothetical protein
MSLLNSKKAHTHEALRRSLARYSRTSRVSRYNRTNTVPCVSSLIPSPAPSIDDLHNRGNGPQAPPSSPRSEPFRLHFDIDTMAIAPTSCGLSHVTVLPNCQTIPDNGSGRSMASILGSQPSRHSAPTVTNPSPSSATPRHREAERTPIQSAGTACSTPQYRYQSSAEDQRLTAQLFNWLLGAFFLSTTVHHLLTVHMSRPSLREYNVYIQHTRVVLSTSRVSPQLNSVHDTLYSAIRCSDVALHVKS